MKYIKIYINHNNFQYTFHNPNNGSFSRYFVKNIAQGKRLVYLFKLEAIKSSETTQDEISNIIMQKDREGIKTRTLDEMINSQEKQREIYKLMKRYLSKNKSQ